MCPYKQQGYEYTLVLNMPNSEYGKVLNMAGFAICECSAAFWICENMPWHISECILGSK